MKTRVLGLDPGAVNTGWAVYDQSTRNRIVAAGCIKTPPGTYPAVAKSLSRQLINLHNLYNPSAWAIERFTRVPNQSVALKLAGSHYAIGATAGVLGVDCNLVNATDVSKFLGIRKGQRQVERKACIKEKLEDMGINISNVHARDAAAVILTYLNSEQER